MTLSELSPEDLACLADLQVNSLEVSKKTPTTQHDVASKFYVDEQVQVAVTLAQEAVTNLINGAGPSMDTLKELSEALLNNPSLGSVLTSSIANVQTAVTSEAVSRAEAVQELKDSASVESSLRNQYRIDDQQIVEMKISAETSMRMESEAQLRSDFASADAEEKSARLSSEAEINSRIDSEASMRSSVDTYFGTLIEEEKKVREDADLLLSSRVDAEVQDRVLAVGVEASARTMLAEDLNQKVSQETADRQFDVANLSSSKFSTSPYYSGGSESYLKIEDDAFLYFGTKWRVRANNGGIQKRLQFEYSADGSDAGFRCAVPFIRS